MTIWYALLPPACWSISCAPCGYNVKTQTSLSIIVYWVQVLELGMNFLTADDMLGILAVKLKKRLGFGIWAKLHITGMHVEGKVWILLFRIDYVIFSVDDFCHCVLHCIALKCLIGSLQLYRSTFESNTIHYWSLCMWRLLWYNPCTL